MKVSEMIKRLQKIQSEHGDLEIYEYTDWAFLRKYETSSFPTVDKIYSRKHEDAEYMRDELSSDDLEVADEELDDVDLTKPIVKGVVI